MELMWGERPGAHQIIFPTSLGARGRHQKAAGAWSEALWRLIPTLLLRSKAFSQDHSDRDPHRIDSKASHGHVEVPGCPADVGRRTGADEVREFGER